MNPKASTALQTGTVPLPPPPAIDPAWRDPIFGMRVGESRTDIIDGVPITMEIGVMRGMRFIESKRLP